MLSRNEHSFLETNIPIPLRIFLSDTVHSYLVKTLISGDKHSSVHSRNEMLILELNIPV